MKKNNSISKEPKNLVILYILRMDEGDKRYNIYSKDDEILYSTNDKYDLYIHLDLLGGYEPKRIVWDKYRVRHFNDFVYDYYTIVGKSYRLGRKSLRKRKRAYNYNMRSKLTFAFNYEEMKTEISCPLVHDRNTELSKSSEASQN